MTTFHRESGLFVLQNQPLIYISKKGNMIYLRHTTDLQMLYIPKEGRCATGNVHLKASNTINQTGFSFVAVDEETSLLYHKVLVELSDNIQPGEYEYTFSDEIGELSNGLLVIGELESPIEYTNETEYEQYEE